MQDAELALRAGRNTIGDLLSRSADRYRDKIALRWGDTAFSYRDLDQAAQRTGAALLGSGLQSGDRVVAYGRNSDRYLIAWLGCCKAGLVHVPANYALTATELRYIAEQSRASLILHDPAMADNATACGIPTRLFADLMAPGAPISASVADGDVAQICYTSGTTGLPKGAVMTHRALMSEYVSCIVECQHSAGDVVLAALPLYHTAQMHCFTMPQIMAGAEIVLIESPVPATCLALMEQHRVSSFFAPPTVWINLLRHPDFDRYDLSSLRRAYYGAAIMPVPVLHELRARIPGVQAFNCYGQSEMSPLATVLKPEEHDARPSSVGRPVLHVQTRVVDLDMNDVPPGTRGEIVHRSPHLMLRYWDKPEATAEAFAGGWFHSGDIGVFDEEGYLYVVDRIKDVINTGGVLVASREVEDALFTHPAVAEAAVIPVPDTTWIEAIAAVIVLRKGAEVTEAALIAHARASLAPFKVPKRVFFADELPKNTAGKLLKRELRRTYAGQTGAVMGLVS
jgi:fatty-acyl-CoA synthase